MAGNRYPQVSRLNFFHNAEAVLPGGVVAKSIPHVPQKIDVEQLHNNKQQRYLSLLSKKYLERLLRYKDACEEVVDEVTGEVTIAYALPADKLTGKKSLRKDKRFGKHFPCSVARDGGELYVVSSGVFGRGAFGKVKALQHVGGSGTWRLIKTQMIDEGSAANRADAEAEQMALSSREIGSPRPMTSRLSASKDGKVQHTMILKLMPGMPLSELIASERDPVTGHSVDVTLPLGVRNQIAISMIEKELDLFQPKSLHRRLLHRDLKPGNFVIDICNQRAAIVDYGAAAEPDEEGKVVEGRLRGTSIYLSEELRAEMLQEAQKFSYDEKTEVYALGISIAELYGLVDFMRVPRKDGRSNLAEMQGETYVVKDMNDPFCQDNNTAPQRYLTKMLALVRWMTASADCRCSLEEALAKLKMIQEDFLEDVINPYFPPKVQVGVLDVHEFRHANLAKQERLLAELENFDEVWLTDSKPNRHRDYKVYIKMKAMLQAKSFLVGDKVFAGRDSQAVMQGLEGYLARRPVPARCARVTELGLDNEPERSSRCGL